MPEINNRRKTYDWTPEEEDRLRRLYQNETVSISEIARRFGLSRSAIKARVRKLGLPVRQHHQAFDEKVDREAYAYVFGFFLRLCEIARESGERAETVIDGWHRLPGKGEAVDLDSLERTLAARAERERKPNG